MPEGTHTGATDPGLAGQRGFGLLEAVVALLVFSVGMLAVAGLSLSAGQLTAKSSFRTDQTFAADHVFGALQEEDFAAVSGSTWTVQVGAHDYSVDVSVNTVSSDVKRVQAAVSGVADLRPDTFTTMIYRPDASYPTSP